jgi:hypothetical protein
VSGREHESRTVTASIDAASARRVVRSHLGRWWMLGLNRSAVARRGGVYGFVLGRYVHARGVPPGSALGLIKDVPVINGRLVPRALGCELSVRVHSPRMPALLPALAFGLGATLSLAALVATGAAALLFGFIFFAALLALSVMMRRAHRAVEPEERQLVQRWLEELERDLNPGGGENR